MDDKREATQSTFGSDSDLPDLDLKKLPMSKPLIKKNWRTQYSGWLCPSTDSADLSWCKICQCSIRCKKDNVLKHSASSKHILRARSIKASEVVTSGLVVNNPNKEKQNPNSHKLDPEEGADGKPLLQSCLITIEQLKPSEISGNSQLETTNLSSSQSDSELPNLEWKLPSRFHSKKDWLKQYSGWLRSSTDGKGDKFWCKTCKCSIKCKKDDVVKHSKSKRHKLRVRYNRTLPITNLVWKDQKPTLRTGKLKRRGSKQQPLETSADEDPVNVNENHEESENNLSCLSTDFDFLWKNWMEQYSGWLCFFLDGTAKWYWCQICECFIRSKKDNVVKHANSQRHKLGDSSVLSTTVTNFKDWRKQYSSWICPSPAGNVDELWCKACECSIKNMDDDASKHFESANHKLKTSSIRILKGNYRPVPTTSGEVELENMAVMEDVSGDGPSGSNVALDPEVPDSEVEHRPKHVLMKRWMKQYSNWLCPSPTGKAGALWCKTCKCLIKSKKDNVMKHVQTTKHKFKTSVAVTNLDIPIKLETNDNSPKFEVERDVNENKESCLIIIKEPKRLEIFEEELEDANENCDGPETDLSSFACEPELLNSKEKLTTSVRKNDWLKQYSDWLCPSPTGKAGALWCKTCECLIKCKKDNVVKHSESKKHTLSACSISPTQSIASLLDVNPHKPKPNSNSSKLDLERATKGQKFSQIIKEPLEISDNEGLESINETRDNESDSYLSDCRIEQDLGDSQMEKSPQRLTTTCDHSEVERGHVKRSRSPLVKRSRSPLVKRSRSPLVKITTCKERCNNLTGIGNNHSRRIPLICQNPFFSDSDGKFFKDSSRRNVSESIPTKLYDQHFATGIRLDEVSTGTSSMYIRSRRTPVEKSGFSIINSPKDKFTVMLEVPHFLPDELKVRVIGTVLEIDGRHTKRQDDHGAISRHFTREYSLPEDVMIDHISSTLSSDGVLTIEAPKKLKKTNTLLSGPLKLPPPAERKVPIKPS